ncbi:hypothetical protein [Alloscardovia omnicolens]|uniref:hypothetical protein n=1 Tax=Alloscardovia omnicolens TaxID=419015 RepID=UPI003A644510
MSSVSESITEHITIGDIRRRYGISAVGLRQDGVTLTSVADALEDITPGALYISSTAQYDPRIVHAAAKRGAYAIVFMVAESADNQVVPVETEIPVLFAQLNNGERARIAADMAGDPSAALAVFAVQGDREGQVIEQLYDILHYLGNPMGVIDARGGMSLDRELSISTPFSPLDIQRMLFVMAEDGATSVIIHVDDAVLESLALTSVSIDVYTNTIHEAFNVPEIEPRRSFLNRKSVEDNGEELKKLAQQNLHTFGAQIREATRCVETTDDARALVREVLGESTAASHHEIATAVTMILAAGVKRNSIKSALRLAREMKAE